MFQISYAALKTLHMALVWFYSFLIYKVHTKVDQVDYIFMLHQTNKALEPCKGLSKVTMCGKQLS